MVRRFATLCAHHVHAPAQRLGSETQRFGGRALSLVSIQTALAGRHGPQDAAGTHAPSAE